MATSNDFRAIFGFDPPPGQTLDEPPQPGKPPPTPASQALPADRPATPEERAAILGTPTPIIPPPRPPTIMDKSWISLPKLQQWDNPQREDAPRPIMPVPVPGPRSVPALSPWEAGLREDAPPPVPGVWPAISGAVTGDTSVRHPEIGPLSIPGLGLSGGPGLSVAGQMMLSRDPEALKSVIKRNAPNAVFGKDEDGRETVRVGDNPPMYLDRPGFTPQKLAFYGPQTAAAMLTRGRTIPGMMGWNAVQEEASNIGSHMLGGAPGWVDPLGLLTSTGATGALGVAGKVIGSGVRGFANWVTDEAGNITAAARRLLADEFGHTPTYGQVTGNPYQLKREDMLLNTKAAPDEASRLSDLHRGNLQATNDAKSGLIAEASGATPVTPGTPPITPQGFQGDEAALGNQMLGNIRTRYEALTDAERNAWGRLGPLSPDTQSGRSVQFSPAVSNDILASTFQTVRDRVGLPAGPNGQFTAGQLRNGAQQVVDALDVVRGPTMGTGPQVGTQAFNLGHLQDMRQQLQNIIDNAPNRSVASAVRAIRNNVDAAITRAETTPGSLIGNPQSLTDFRTANQATRDRYNFVAPSSNPAAADFMGDATRQIETPGGRRYAMGGQEAVDQSLGSGNIVEPGGGTGDILTHLHDRLGADSDALNAARGVVAKRPLYGRSASPEVPGTEATTGAGYGSTSKRITAQLTGPGSQVSDTLLDPAMQLRMHNFRDALDTLNRAYTPSSPRLNTSGTAYFGQNPSQLPLPGFVKDFIAYHGARRAIDTAITGGRRPVLAFPGGPPAPVVGQAARVGGLLGTATGP